ncbi:TonB-dependent receptor [Alteromonas sp. CYL-A6]|uniref:TonB-dependent receptor n=1 Tax=Alteromonas nitratireducens TaxID=3390813 RepID=UPI0034AD0040
MNKQSVLAACIATALSGTAMATTISGKVTNQAGQPVAGAQVKIEGAQKSVFTDEKGMYRFENVTKKHVHLHVYSDRYIHGDNDLGVVVDDQQVDFVLAPASVENIIVTATAMESSVLESVTPVSVLNKEALRRVEAPTLGETLKTTPGVHSTYFGPVSSSPVIRGNDGPRVMIVQNSLDVSDVSRIGPDHNVTGNTSSATQVEVLRGPATLQYGSGAIGGVVNIVDNRIPSQLSDGLEGEADINYSTVNNGKYARGELNGSSGNIAWHLDGFSRNTDNADIPGFASVEPDDDEPSGVLENSQMATSSIVGGLSYIGDSGFVGLSVEQLDNRYGVPGHAHAHGEEEHDEHDDHDDHADEAMGEDGVALDVEMTRYQLAGEWLSPFDGISRVKFGAAYTDYQHVEIEDGQRGTQFKNKSTNVRVTAYHEDINDWHGVIGFQADSSDYEAIGDEAYTPPTETNRYALFLIEQKKVGDLLFELGGRIEHTRYETADNAFELTVAHDEEHDEHDEYEAHDDADVHDEHLFSFDDYTFTTASFSAGMNWEYGDGQSVALTLSRSERAPSQQELFAAGQHLATRTFEVGLVYDLNDEGEVGDVLRRAEKEVSNNIDLTFRKFKGDWGYTVSLFYNQADDYIYHVATGLTSVSEHEEHDEHEEPVEAVHDEHELDAHDDHSEEGLPVFAFRQNDADIWGMEAEAYYDLSVNWRLTLFGDVIKAELDDQDLPRIPPLRLGSTLSYQSDSWSGDVGITWYDDQTDAAPFETATDGYTLLDASLQYELTRGNVDWIVYARGNNLTDEEARVHTSFLKDQAPLPGRNLTIGVRALF